MLEGYVQWIVRVQRLGHEVYAGEHRADLRQYLAARAPPGRRQPLRRRAGLRRASLYDCHELALARAARVLRLDVPAEGRRVREVRRLAREDRGRARGGGGRR